MKKIFIAFLFMTGAFFACRKRPDPVQQQPNHLILNISNEVNGKPMVLGSQQYKNRNGDDFSITNCKYYISNIKLSGTSGDYLVPESYYLIDQKNEASHSISIRDVPHGDYSKISFLIGVDSARNVSGAQTGALDPNNGMFWDWNTGYIMALLEGESPQAALSSGLIAFHMGGFSGKNNVIRQVILDLPGGLTVSENKAGAINIGANIAEWFQTPHLIDFSKFSVVSTPEEDAKTIADNYADMFFIKSIE